MSVIKRVIREGANAESQISSWKFSATVEVGG